MKNETGHGKKPKVSRRQLLKLTVGVSVGGGAALLLAPAASAAEALCADVEDIFSNYESLNYSKVSPIEDKTCGNCAFFDHAAQGDCRFCEMMVATTDITGYCDSWSVIEE